MTGLPRLAVWLLERRLGDEWRDFVLGDLEEGFADRSAASPAAARAWVWWQTIRCLAWPPPARPSQSRGDSMFRAFAADVRYAVRAAVRAPSFAAAVVAVLALGIGANTAIFTIVNAVLLRPLPFEQPEHLVRLYHIPPQNTFPGIKRFPVSAANFYDWKHDAHMFDGMALYRFRRFALSGAKGAEAVLAGAVGKDFFELVGTHPELGRTFLSVEDAPGREHIAVISHRFWTGHLGSARDVLGRTLRLDGEPYTIVGVMPASFSIEAWGATARDIWVPLAQNDAARTVRDNHNLQVVARLKRGVAVAQADAELAAISSRLERDYPQANVGWGATVVLLRELIVEDHRATLVMLLAAVGLVLLIACANVGNLLFARGLTRRKEIAIRAALGAGRGRVFQQLVTESLALAAAGGALGLLVAHAALSAGAALLAKQVPRADEISIDNSVLLFVAGVSMLTGVIAGAMPALRAGRTDVNESLKEGGRGDHTLGTRTRRALIICEVALSVVLLMGAGVMLRSLLALRRVDAGFNPRNVLTLRVQLPETRYSTPARVSGFYEAALQRIRALPGVQSAGAVDDLPVTGGSVQPLVIQGHAERLPRDQPTVEVRRMTPGYLKTMNIPVVRGRDVADSDVDVILVGRAAAKLLWGDGDPIGQRVTLPLQSKTVVKEVIGIVGDVKQGELSEPAAPTVFEYTREHSWRGLAIAMRTSVPPASIAQSAAAVIHGLDPEQPVEDIRTMEEVMDETLTTQRLSAWLLGMFAAAAVVLAAVGIYSVLSYIVRGRRREIGIRTALGARTADVVRLVVIEGMTPAGIGLAIGAIAAAASARLVSKLVFGVSTADPLTFAIVTAGLAAVALLASLLPAYRASRQDPISALRAD